MRCGVFIATFSDIFDNEHEQRIFLVDLMKHNDLKKRNLQSTDLC